MRIDDCSAELLAEVVKQYKSGVPLTVIKEVISVNYNALKHYLIDINEYDQTRTRSTSRTKRENMLNSAKAALLPLMAKRLSEEERNLIIDDYVAGRLVYDLHPDVSREVIDALTTGVERKPNGYDPDYLNRLYLRQLAARDERVKSRAAKPAPLRIYRKGEDNRGY